MNCLKLIYFLFVIEKAALFINKTIKKNYINSFVSTVIHRSRHCFSQLASISEQMVQPPSNLFNSTIINCFNNLLQVQLLIMNFIGISSWDFNSKTYGFKEFVLISSLLLHLYIFKPSDNPQNTDSNKFLPFKKMLVDQYF